MGLKVKTHKPRIKRKKKTEKKITKEKLLKLWSAVCFKLYGNRCLVCKTRKATGTHHFFGKRSHMAVMFDPRNGLPLCFMCHIVQIHQQGDSEHARQVMVERLGMIGYFKLEQDAHKTKEKLTLLDLDEIKSELLSLLS